MIRAGDLHLTYCTNVHPGESWEEVRAGLERYALPLKRLLSPNAPFGLGLRLSAQATEELLAAGRLEAFRCWLDEHGLYVALLNGFPYGAFHRRRVKEDVFRPDWLDEARVRYTLQLARVLAELLPDGIDGGISTCPISYKRFFPVAEPAAPGRAARNLGRVAAALADLHERTGKEIHLDIEPEPDGWIENSEETAAFFREQLLPVGRALIREALGVSASEAESRLRRHLGVCYDTCHFAVEYEEPERALDRLESTGIRIGRVQVSAAPCVPLPDAATEREALARQLEPFAESIYLHQTLERRTDGSLRRYPDLPDALPNLSDPEAREWRIHFHVPLFAEPAPPLRSTRDEIPRLLDRLKQRPFTRHLEIETYTWEVLPPPLKLDLVESIRREYAWTLALLEGEAAAPEPADPPSR